MEIGPTVWIGPMDIVLQQANSNRGAKTYRHRTLTDRYQGDRTRRGKICMEMGLREIRHLFI